MSGRLQALGRWGEMQAADYLAANGYAILARNVRTHYGEIDLIANQDGPGDPTSLVFVEVKTRRSAAYGLPEEGVNRRKWEHLCASIQAYLLDRPDWQGEWRLDVIAVTVKGQGEPPEIIHFENISFP